MALPLSRPFTLPQPARRGPLRAMSTVYRRSDAPADKPKPRTNGSLNSTEDVVLEAVKLGYKIADDQILKGQALARRLRKASIRADVGDAGDLVDHGMRLMRQLAVLLLEVTETTMSAPTAVGEVVKRIRQETSPSESSSEVTPLARESKQAHSIPVTVQSKRAARVSITLQEPVTAQTEVYALYRKEKPRIPLTDVSLVKDADGYVLAVNITDSQEPGTYQGFAVDASGKPVGSIVITLAAQKATPSASAAPATPKAPRAPRANTSPAAGAVAKKSSKSQKSKRK